MCVIIACALICCEYLFKGPGMLLSGNMDPFRTGIHVQLQTQSQGIPGTPNSPRSRHMEGITPGSLALLHTCIPCSPSPVPGLNRMGHDMRPVLPPPSHCVLLPPLLSESPAVATSLRRGPAPGCHRDGEDIYRCCRERKVQLRKGGETNPAIPLFTITQVIVHFTRETAASLLTQQLRPEWLLPFPLSFMPRDCPSQPCKGESVPGLVGRAAPPVPVSLLPQVRKAMPGHFCCPAAFAGPGVSGSGLLQAARVAVIKGMAPSPGPMSLCVGPPADPGAPSHPCKEEDAQSREQSCAAGFCNLLVPDRLSVPCHTALSQGKQY